MGRKILILLILNTFLFTLCAYATTNAVSQSFKISVYIPIMPGLNAPLAPSDNQEIEILNEEMMTITKEVIEDNQTIIVKSIVPR